MKVFSWRSEDQSKRSKKNKFITDLDNNNDNSIDNSSNNNNYNDINISNDNIVPSLIFLKTWNKS